MATRRPAGRSTSCLYRPPPKATPWFVARRASPFIRHGSAGFVVKSWALFAWSLLPPGLTCKRTLWFLQCRDKKIQVTIMTSSF